MKSSASCRSGRGEGRPSSSSPDALPPPPGEGLLEAAAPGVVDAVLGLGRGKSGSGCSFGVLGGGVGKVWYLWLDCLRRKVRRDSKEAEAEAEAEARLLGSPIRVEELDAE